MTVTYEPISTQTLGTAVADVYFNSIPQTYTDLVLVISSNIAAYAQTGFRLNSDNASNYSVTQLAGTGTSALSQRITSDTYGRFDWYGGGDTTGRNVIVAQFFNYTNTTTFKTIISRGNNAGGSFAGTTASVNLWRKTPAAITSINVLTSTGGQFSIGSTFTLYGIKAE